MNQPFAIAIHGGAGTILKENFTSETEKEYYNKLQEAIDAGYSILEKGGTSINAVEAAINVMEDSPLFNAGKGSVFTHDEKNEMDASIMDGKTLNAGAICGVTTIKNPISAAKLVMQKSEHVLLSGKGAEEFAKLHSVEFVDASYFFDTKRFEHLQKIKASQKIELDHNNNQPKDYKYGTVGAVAVDKDGNIASGTSTGGMTNKRFGRVGDSPIIGAGTYANNKTCGVSCTGHGEFFIQQVVAYDVSALMEYKQLKIEEASDFVVNSKLKEIGGDGGLIAIDKNCNIVMPFNTPGMFRAHKKSNGETIVKMYND